MVAAMKLSTESINNLKGTFRSVEDIYVSRIAHVTNLGAKDCLHAFHDKMKYIRDIL